MNEIMNLLLYDVIDQDLLCFVALCQKRPVIWSAAGGFTMWLGLARPDFQFVPLSG